MATVVSRSGKSLSGSPTPDQVAENFVPGGVGDCHPAASHFSEDEAVHEVSRAQLQRAVRIVHAVAVEVERRGWSVEQHSQPEDEKGEVTARPAKEPSLQFTAGDHRFGIRVYEKGVRARGPWEKTVGYYRENPDLSFLASLGIPNGPYDADASGELNLELQAEHSWMLSGRQYRWGDCRSWRLEDRLPHLFRAIEQRITKADRTDQGGQRAPKGQPRVAGDQERQQRVDIERTKAELDGAHHADVLRAQALAWQEADLVRRYCDALEVAYGEDPDSGEWIEWSRRYADRLDPLDKPPTMSGAPAERPVLPRDWWANRTVPPWRRSS